MSGRYFNMDKNSVWTVSDINEAMIYLIRPIYNDITTQDELPAKAEVLLISMYNNQMVSNNIILCDSYGTYESRGLTATDDDIKWRITGGDKQYTADKPPKENARIMLSVENEPFTGNLWSYCGAENPSITKRDDTNTTYTYFYPAPDPQCFEGYNCNGRCEGNTPSEFECVGECTSDNECDNDVCVDNFCVECRDGRNTDCTTGMCQDNMCVNCLDDDDCFSSVCNNETGTCIECNDNNDCPGYCNQVLFICMGNCKNDVDCEGLCEGNFCTGTCKNNADCNEDQLCLNNICTSNASEKLSTGLIVLISIAVLCIFIVILGLYGVF
jgi:hypothetical protein